MSRPIQQLKLTLRRTLRQSHRPLLNNRVFRLHLDPKRLAERLELEPMHIPTKRRIIIGYKTVSVDEIEKFGAVLVPGTQQLHWIEWEELL